MKRTTRALLAALLHVGIIANTTGCVRSNLTELAKAMSNDNATVAVKVSSIYGTGSLVRVNPRTNQTCTISPDGTVSFGTRP